MKLFSPFVLLLVAFSTFNTLAQDMSLSWSDKFDYNNKKEGFFKDFLGSNDKYIYTINNNLAIRDKKANKKLLIVAFDKETMREVNSIALKGFKENTPQKNEYSDLTYHQTIVHNDEVFVFWTKRISNKQEKSDYLYVEAFNQDLKRSKPLTKIFTTQVPTDVKVSIYAKSFLTVLSNPKAGNDLIVGYELPKKDENITFNYIVLDKRLEVSEENKIELPVKRVGKSIGLSSMYSLGIDGNIYIRSFITRTKEERKNGLIGEKNSYCVFSIINSKTGDLTTFDLRDNAKNINDFSYVVLPNKVKIYGLFGDLEKDPSGKSTHGIFYTEIDSRTLDFNGLNYTYFDKSMLNKLFEKDEEDKKKTAALNKKKREKSRANDEESMDKRFGIESMFSVDEENVVLFCSKMYNYSITTCSTSPNGVKSCTTNYYCEKSNVTALRINSDGDIIWGSNLDRLITYDGSHIYDVKVVFENNKFYVIYGSDYDADAEKKSRKSRKSRTDFRDSFEYGIFDYESGKNSKNTFIVNTKTDEDKKTVKPTAITVIDNKFYVNHVKIKQDWLKTAPLCAASIVCWPVAYFIVISGDLKKGQGNLGVISPIDGRSKKSKRK